MAGVTGCLRGRYGVPMLQLLAYGGEQDGKADQPERISKTMILDSDSMVWYPPATQGVSPPPPR